MSKVRCCFISPNIIIPFVVTSIRDCLRGEAKKHCETASGAGHLRFHKFDMIMMKMILRGPVHFAAKKSLPQKKDCRCRQKFAVKSLPRPQKSLPPIFCRLRKVCRFQKLFPFAPSVLPQSPTVQLSVLFCKAWTTQMPCCRVFCRTLGWGMTVSSTQSVRLGG